MRVIVECLAREKIEDIYYYNAYFSLKYANDIDFSINMLIHSLKNFSYIGRCIPEINNERFREIIYRKSRYVGYRIMYYVSEKLNKIFVFNVMSTRQNFYQLLKKYNYFKNYLNF